MRWMISWAFSIAASVAVPQVALASENFPSIVVTVAPLKPYVDEIIHGQGDAQSLLRPGQEPHDFSMTIPQGQMLDKADIIIVPDLSINPFLKRLLAKNTRAKVIELSQLEGAEPLPYEKSNPWVDAMKDAPAPSSNEQHWWRSQKAKPREVVKNPDVMPAPRIWPMDGKKEEKIQPAADELPVEKPEEKKETSLNQAKKEEPKIDPHLWLDPERMAAIAVPLANVIGKDYPNARPELLANARTLATHLRREVIPNMRDMLRAPTSDVTAMNRPQLSFITYHAAYQYFLQRFHLKHNGEITSRPEATLGAATTAKMLHGSEGLHVKCIIGEQGSALMSRLATNTGARIVLLSPEQLPLRKDVDVHDWIRNDYDRFLYVTAKAFAGCL